MKKGKRHAAFSVNLGEASGEHQLMCSTSRCMEIFTTSGVYQIFTPESLDPDEKNLDMPGMAKKLSDVGTVNWIVARVMVQNYKLVEANVHFAEADKATFTQRLHDLMNSILTCSEISESLTRRVDEVEKQVTLGGITASGNIFTDFPTTENIEKKLTVFLTKAKHAIQRIIDIFNLFYKSSITNPRVDTLIGWCKESEIPDEVIQCLEQFEPVAKYLVELRNSQEHPSKDKQFEFADFSILPTKEISAPLWGINSANSSIHKEMAALTKEFVVFTEWLIIYLVLNKQQESPIFEHKVLEIPCEHRDRNCPIKYSIEICFKQKGEQDGGHNSGGCAPSA